jgi:hypothetical protein
MRDSLAFGDVAQYSVDASIDLSTESFLGNTVCRMLNELVRKGVQQVCYARHPENPYRKRSSQKAVFARPDVDSVEITQIGGEASDKPEPPDAANACRPQKIFV